MAWQRAGAFEFLQSNSGATAGQFVGTAPHFEETRVEEPQGVCSIQKECAVWRFIYPYWIILKESRGLLSSATQLAN